ncbi:MAG: HAMP domain-containing sensor histidine kinase [Lachnospiraceae bacterium]|nr:HAMP domain-containing sensor histidine kinase [Lachnospiraceae bacterium]
MRKKLHLPSYLPNAYFFILTASLLFVFLCGFWGVSLLNSQHKQELDLISNIAGAVLSEYPEAEELFVSTLRDTKYIHVDEGLSLLSKYGYRQNLLMSDIPYYRSALSNFATLLGLVFLCGFLLISFSFYRLSKNQKKQEMMLHTLLDRYLSEDYSVLETEVLTDSIFSETFTDPLYKLGNKLMTKTRALAEERDYTKTLVTDISHQLKTPISALKTCLTMCTEADTEEDRTDFLHRCILQMQNLESLVTVLVNVSRLETSLISFRQEAFPLSDLLTDAVNTVYEKALQKNISVEVLTSEQDLLPEKLLSSADGNASGISLLLDRRWSAEAIANILDNAIKYSPAGSTVTIRLHQFYSYISLEITDQGIGIPKEEYNQIFKRFYRGSHPLVKQTEGTGVGLFLARRIIEEQGGAVSVKPATKQGTVFVVRLPLLS